MRGGGLSRSSSAFRTAKTPGASARFRVAARARAPRGARRDNTLAPVVPQDPDVFRAMLGMPADPWSEAGSLTANVWAPEGAEDLPVMVWVHGGGYVGGSNSSPRTDAARLAAAGQVVVVALSYRLGVFGFLRPSPNWARDSRTQRMSASWTWSRVWSQFRENVAAFGGDPSLGHGFRRIGRRSGGGHAARDAALRAVCSAGRSCRAAPPSVPERPTRRPMCRSASCARAGSTPATARELLAWPAERVLDAQRAFTEVVAAESMGFRCPISR